MFLLPSLFARSFNFTSVVDTAKKISLPFHLKLIGFTQTNIALVNQYCYIVLSIEIFIINQIKIIYFPQVRPGRDPFWLCEWCVLGCYFLLRIRSSDPEIV